MASAGTPNAADWLVIFKVYIVLAWIPHFRNSEPGSHSHRVLIALLLMNQISNICTSRVLNQDEPKILSKLVDELQLHLMNTWPERKKSPNMHYAEHLAEISLMFGPPSYTACWTGERIIGSLVRTPKNGGKSLPFSLPF